ncbi:serine protease SSP1-like [Melanaphis sacchari]|uniref:serine protease SSP1-like n=1 Tax=Melanaphis sacchari TaxID=742174 RepID=UPI000DC13941|nr:serine protease SSP1-like [Melanaphis sacchari]
MAATTTVTIEYGMSNNQNIDLISKGILFDVRKYPFLVYIRLFKSSGVVSECSGSLISPLFVLTAAHCTDKIEANNIVVFHYYNLFMKSQQYVKAVYQHKSYKKNLIYNDISIIRLKYPFRNVNRYLNLSGHPDEFNDTADWNCTVFGFGISERSNNYEKLGYMTNLSVTYGYKKCFLDILDYQFRFGC